MGSLSLRRFGSARATRGLPVPQVFRGWSLVIEGASSGVAFTFPGPLSLPGLCPQVTPGCGWAFQRPVQEAKGSLRAEGWVFLPPEWVEALL